MTPRMPRILSENEQDISVLHDCGSGLAFINTLQPGDSISYKRHVYCSTQNRSAQMAGIDVKETYCVSRAVPKSDESVVRGMLNQGM